MAIKHRKLFPEENTTTYPTYCDTFYCDPSCPYHSNCVPYPYVDYLTPPPPPPLPPQSHRVSPYVIIFICVVASFFLLISYYVIIAKSCAGWGNNGRNPQQAQSDNGDEEEFIDGNRVDHPIWFITTVGLQQSIINSITVCKYKKSEGLIEGTDCSVCLNEFQDDETLRILPKCNHAFHISCIDTWLRSHTNCPMCRAYIVSAATVTSSPTDQQHLDTSTLIMDTQIENNSEIDCESGERNGGENRTETEEEGEINPERILKHDVNCNEDDTQSMKRSVSLDSSMAETICIGLADFGDCSAVVADQVDDSEKSHSTISSLVKCLHKSPVCMKRSFSCSGRFLSPRHNRSSDEIVPL